MRLPSCVMRFTSSSGIVPKGIDNGCENCSVWGRTRRHLPTSRELQPPRNIFTPGTGVMPAPSAIGCDEFQLGYSLAD
jgi:hypothetical protein